MRSDKRTIRPEKGTNDVSLRAKLAFQASLEIDNLCEILKTEATEHCPAVRGIAMRIGALNDAMYSAVEDPDELPIGEMYKIVMGSRMPRSVEQEIAA